MPNSARIGGLPTPLHSYCLQQYEVSRAHLPLIIHGSLCILNRSLKNVAQHSSVSALCNSCRKRYKDRVKTQAMWRFTCSYKRTIRLLLQEEERGGAACFFFFFFFFLLFNIFLYTSSPAGFFSQSQCTCTIFLIEVDFFNEKIGSAC